MSTGLLANAVAALCTGDIIHQIIAMVAMGSSAAGNTAGIITDKLAPRKPTAAQPSVHARMCIIPRTQPKESTMSAIPPPLPATPFQ